MEQQNLQGNLILSIQEQSKINSITNHQPITSKQNIHEVNEQKHQQQVYEHQQHPENMKNIQLQQIDELQRQIISAQVLDEAVNQRKRFNFERLRLYQQHHRTYYHNHINILVWMQSQLSKNIERIRTFYEQLFNYFSFIRDGYKNIYKQFDNKGHLGVLASETNGVHNWYGSIRDGIIGLLKIKSQAAETAQRFYHWMQQSLIAKLNQSMNIYENPIQAFSPAILSKKKIVDQCLKNFNQKFFSIEKFINTGEGIGKTDLLYQELLLADIAKNVKQKVIDWGKIISQFWQTLQNNESIFIHSVQKSIQLFFIEYSRIHKETQQIEIVKQLWQKMKTQDDTIYNYSIQRLLVQQQKKFVKEIVGKQVLKNIDFQKFVQLQKYDQIFGSIQTIIDGLFLKRFSCKIDNNNSDIFIYSTVDGHLVFVIQINKKPLNKMIIRQIQVSRINQYSIQAVQKQKGLIFNKWNKQILHFTNSDDLEEFLFCMGIVPEEFAE